MRDFIENFLVTNDAEIRDLCKAAVFFEQPVRLWSVNRGRQRTISRPVSKYPQEFLASIARNVTSQSCSLVDIYDEVVDEKYIIRRPLVVENRVVFALDVAEILWSEEAFKLVRRGLPHLLNVILEGDVDKEQLVKILTRLRRIHFNSDEFQKLLTPAKNLLMSELVSIEDFSHFIKFEKSFKQAVTDQEHEIVIGHFKAFCARDISAKLYEINRPELLIDYTSSLRRVAAIFQMDLESRLTDLEYRAKKLREELDNYTMLALRIAEEEMDYETTISKEREIQEAQEDFTEDDIDALFENLLDSMALRTAKEIRPYMRSSESKLLETIFKDRP